MISLVFFYRGNLLFSGFPQFKGSFVRGQINCFDAKGKLVENRKARREEVSANEQR